MSYLNKIFVFGRGVIVGIQKEHQVKKEIQENGLENFLKEFERQPAQKRKKEATTA